MRRFLFALLALSVVASAADEFPPGPDSKPQQGIAKGTMIKDAYTAKDGSVFPGTQREYQIYLPAGHDKAKPAVFMVFQDGVRFYQSFVPTFFDNLIAAGAMPPTIGIFLDPGVHADTTASNRSFEYDTLSDQYARFLLEEILPEVEKTYRLRQDAAGRAIAGISSGGICAFTAVTMASCVAPTGT